MTKMDHFWSYFRLNPHIDFQWLNLSHFTSKSIVQPFYTVLNLVLPDFYDAPSKRSKIAKFVLFYMQKYCTTILHSFKPGSLQKVAILKRSKMAISNQSKWQFWSGQNMTMTMMTSIVQPILTCFYLLYAFKLILPV